MNEPQKRNLLSRLFLIGEEELEAPYEAPEKGPASFFLAMAAVAGLAGLVSLANGGSFGHRRGHMINSHQLSVTLGADGGMSAADLGSSENLLTGAPIGLIDIEDPPVLAGFIDSIDPPRLRYIVGGQAKTHTVLLGKHGDFGGERYLRCYALRGPLQACGARFQPLNHPGLDLIVIGPEAEQVRTRLVAALGADEAGG